MPSRESYADSFSLAGFVDIQSQDMSDDWRRFTSERHDEFRRNRERHLRVHGEVIVAQLDDFYATVARLFAGGNLGGIRLIAKRREL